ncbi:NfeD family protein [Aestuariivirga sp.]|uniref:NfeD family protein n=1 Tax=Aestuariivirga sp. TaxID=2650926 RepID=UPI00359475CE
MDQLFPFLGQWTWWVAAGVFLLLELMAPGVFFIWLAIAAAATGLADNVFGLPWQAELLIFAALSVVSVFAGRKLYRGPNAEPDDNPYLNRRQLSYVGQSFTLREPIVDGHGKLAIEDTIWEIEGPDLAAGARVTITAVKGMRLVVASA